MKQYICPGCSPSRWAHWHDSPTEEHGTPPNSTDNPGHRDLLIPPYSLQRERDTRLGFFLRAPNHKYRINNLKAVRGGEKGRALEVGALREELKLSSEGWQAAAGNSDCPSRAGQWGRVGGRAWGHLRRVRLGPFLGQGMR